MQPFYSITSLLITLVCYLSKHIRIIHFPHEEAKRKPKSMELSNSVVKLCKTYLGLKR